MEPHCRLSVEINQSPMPFVASAHLNEIALAALHQTIHNDSSSTLNLHRPLYILTTAEDTLRCHSLYSISTLYSNPSRNALTSSPLQPLCGMQLHVRQFLLNYESHISLSEPSAVLTL